MASVPPTNTFRERQPRRRPALCGTVGLEQSLRYRAIPRVSSQTYPRSDPSRHGGLSAQDRTRDMWANELLARFNTSSGWVRRSNQTVKPDAFIPYPYPALSVTRHRKLTPHELWHLGRK